MKHSLEYQRQLKAEKLGEGAWMNKATKIWYRVDVTFYPKVKRWISDGVGGRREISEKELRRDYGQLEI